MTIELTSILMQWTLLSKIDVICLSWISVTFPLGNIMKQFTFFFPLKPWSAALPVSPEVAPKIVIWLWMAPFSKKYSKVLPIINRSLNEMKQIKLMILFTKRKVKSVVFVWQVDDRWSQLDKSNKKLTHGNRKTIVLMFYHWSMTTSEIRKHCTVIQSPQHSHTQAYILTQTQLVFKCWTT